MGEFIKSALIFVGGMAAGACCITNAALKSKTVTETLKQTVKREITDAINRSLHEPTDDTGARSVSYYDYYKRRSAVRYGPDKINYTRFVECDDLIFGSRKDAEKVLEDMANIIQVYGVVTVVDFYDLAGIDQSDYAMHKYGWTNIAEGRVIRTHDGYHVKLPKALEVK